jgi:hypothetical protein
MLTAAMIASEPPQRSFLDACLLSARRRRSHLSYNVPTFSLAQPRIIGPVRIKKALFIFSINATT